MIVKVTFKIDNKVYHTTVKFVDYDEIMISNHQLKLNVAKKIIDMAYELNSINDVVYHNIINNTIVNAIEIVSVTIPNYNKTE